jgi:hypothetical protein
LQLGELAVNTYDGAIYAKRVRPGIGTDIIQFGGGFPEVTNLIYVTEDGNDTNSGLKLGDAKATIKAAVAIASAGSVIKVSAGRYIEDNPIELPDQVSIVGDSLREVEVQPQNIDEDLFYVGTGCYIAQMSFTVPAGSESNGAAVVAFNPNNQRYIDQSPYIQNCTNFIPGSIGLKVDGEHALGPLKSMVLDSYTQYNQGGIGASMTNEGYAQLVSLFTICDDIAVYCGTGGACDLTNSNSSFGNYGLVAEGTSPLKYTGIVTTAADSNADTFILNLNTPTLNIRNASYDNTTGILTAYTSSAHRFSVGMGVSIVGLGFTCPYEPGTRYYPSGQKGYIFEIKTVAPGRYVDASNLIAANRTEIVDKSLASIALNYPDFIFPGDSANDASYRYKDSYRLIQQNKQEIVDKSLASIAVEFPDFYFPGDTQSNARSRYYDAYRLIQKNRDVIVGIAWTNTYNAYPTISTTMNKCKRDLGYFIDAISADVFTGGNNYAREFTLQYFNAVGSPIPNGLSGVTTESIYAFQQARNLMKNAISNNLVGAAYSDLTVSIGPARRGSGSPFPVPNTSLLSCSDVKDNIDTLTGIVTASIGAGNTSSLPATPNLGSFTTGGTKCARDLGYFVDAVSTDLFTGGNSYVIGFAEQYFNGTTPIGIATSERPQSIYAFNSVRDYAKKAITNQLNVKDLTITADPNPGIGTTSNVNPYSCTNVRDTIDTLVGIATRAIGDGNLDYINNNITLNGGTFLTGESKCRRDIGYIVDAVASDVRNYTNKSIIAATKSYFTSSGIPLSNGLVGVKSESITAFNSVGTYSKLAINNMLNAKDLSITADPLTGSNTDPLSCANVRTNIDTLVGILTTFVGQENLIGLPSVSMASTIFTMNVGIATQAHTYVPNTGTAKINVVRPFDGQVLYFNDLYYSVGKVIVGSGGTGYTSTPIVTIGEPDTSWGVPATAVATIAGGKITGFEIISNGRGYTTTPTITISSPNSGINTATAIIELLPTYYSILSSTPVSSGITTITINENVPYPVGVGTEVLFYKQSRVLASGHSFEYIGSGTDIANAVPLRGGVPIQDNETDMRNGGLVVYTSTDQSGNFRIGDGVAINQQTGTISGRFYSKSLFSTMTPFILALGGD